MANDRLTELSSIIARDTAIVSEFCKRNNVPTPSFDINAPPTVKIPPNEPAVVAAKDNIIAATRELGILMRGPYSISIDVGFIDAFAFHAISRFDVATKVPVGGEISFEELGERCKVDPSVLRRILRFAMTSGAFCETRPGYVSHSSLSRLIAENAFFRGGSAFSYDECFSAAAKAVDALEKYPSSEEPNQSGWGLANSAGNPMFQELHQSHPRRYQNAATAMDMWDLQISDAPLIHNYPWDSMSTVVDIGGGHGPVSQAIAKHFPGPKFIVQDLAGVIAEGPAKLPEEFVGRISFMDHDMFQPQPVKDADVYYFRSVFHDWPDKYCVKILQALTPALKSGARVVTNDACLSPPGALPPTGDRAKRMWDMNMWLLFNARDREEGDWATLFQKADKRFKFLGARVPSKNIEGLSSEFLLSIIEAEWQP